MKRYIHHKLFPALLCSQICFALIAPAAEKGPRLCATSVYNARYPARYAVDGDPKTRWASSGTRDEYFLIDFGRAVEVDELEIVWEHAHAREYRVQVAGEGWEWETLFHQKDGEGGTERHTGLHGSGRYFRLLFVRPSKWKHVSIWELKFGDSEINELLTQARQSAIPVPEEPVKIDDETKETLRGFGVEEIVFSVRADSADGHWYANFGYWAFDETSLLCGAGGRLCKLNIETGKMTVLIDDPEGTIRDPAVHYDAQKILFSWRRSGTGVFHLYECDLAGGNIVQLTHGIYDDIEPCYLPDGDIIFVSGRCRRWVNCWLVQVATIHRCNGDGSNIRELSANVEQDNTPWVLPDGRIMYQRWEYVDRSQVDYHHLWTMNPDGTAQMVYFGNMHPRNLYIDAKPIPGSEKVVFANCPGHGRREHTGQVATVSEKFGPDDRSALKNISRQNFRDPWPLSEDCFIVAGGRDILALDGAGRTEKLYTLPRKFGVRVNIQEPRPVIRRDREPIIPERVDLTRRTGQLILTDIYFGRNMPGLRRGEIKKLLVLESLPKPVNYTGGMDPLTYGGSFTIERVVGTVPVEDDGSAFIELPANRAFFFVALDRDENSVKRMQSFLTVMPGEVTSCVGCHEKRGTAPVDREGLFPDALARPPSRPEPIENIPEIFDFPRDIQPILDKNCISCHGYDKRKGGVILTGDRGPMFSHSYVTLTLRRQVADGRNLAKGNYPPRALGTSASPLMDKIDGTHHGVTVSEHEQKLIRYWIESAACYPGTYAALGHGSVGGYQKNALINRDENLATADAFRDSVQKRCAECHRRELGLKLPMSMSDELGISFWRFSLDDKRLRFSRHLMFNLSRPEKSLILLAPLAKHAGGLDLCRTDQAGDGGGGTKGSAEREAVFRTTDDPDYRAMLAHIAAGKKYLETEITRFDMPNFRPRRGYLREMQRYGILSESFDPAHDSIDVYELDRRYWRSLWWKPRK